VQRLGAILANLKLPGPGPIALARIEEAVAQVFGPAASGLRVASYRKGKLALEVKSAARAFEYQAFARGACVEALKRKPGLEELAEIVFKNGAWRAHGQR
jgi:hypothetical protein